MGNILVTKIPQLLIDRINKKNDASGDSNLNKVKILPEIVISAKKKSVVIPQNDHKGFFLLIGICFAAYIFRKKRFF